MANLLVRIVKAIKKSKEWHLKPATGLAPSNTLKPR